MNSVTITSVAQKRSNVSPYIRQMYTTAADDVQCLPSANPKNHGKLVDWGTRMYELEFELARKTDEIDELKRRMNRGWQQPSRFTLSVEHTKVRRGEAWGWFW